MWLDKLKEMKDRSGLTTREIAARTGVPEPTLAKIFSGATKAPTLETMASVVTALGYTLNDLFDMGKDQTSEKYLNILNGAGLTRAGKELTEEDKKFLSAVSSALSDWFSKN